MTKLEEVADQIFDGLTAKGFSPNRKEILAALDQRCVDLAGVLDVTPQTAEQYFGSDTAQAWVKNIVTSAEMLGVV